MVVVPKNEKGVRICVDFTKLNKFVKRPAYTAKTPKEAVTSVAPNSSIFSTFDATHGYWQMTLDKDAQKLTTFITPWGRYQFLRAPMGLSSTGNEYSRRGDEALKNVNNIQKVVDDVLMYDSNFEEHLANVKYFLQTCRENKITLSQKKNSVCLVIGILCRLCSEWSWSQCWP